MLKKLVIELSSCYDCPYCEKEKFYMDGENFFCMNPDVAMRKIKNKEIQEFCPLEDA